MKFFKSPFIFLSLFLCSLLSAQEAQFEVNLKTEKSDLKYKVEKFAEEYIKPIMRGDVYDIEVNNVELMTDYQNNNPIYCKSGHELKRGELTCQDESYFSKHNKDERFDDLERNPILPYEVALRANNLDADSSIIISFKISLNQKFKNSLLEFLDNESVGQDELSYAHEDYKRMSDYYRCMKDYPNRCTGDLAEWYMPLSTQSLSYREPNYVINFIDRNSKRVTFYNLKNYRSELADNKNFRFLVNLCEYMTSGYVPGDNRTERFYNNYHEFNDLLIILLDNNGNEIHSTVINTHQPARAFQTSTNRYFSSDSIESGQHTFGILGNHFIFAFDYGSNVLTGKDSDYLGKRNIAGHLIDDSKINYTALDRCRFPGLSSELPAFSIISNYEYHIVIDLDQIDLDKIKSVQIKYVSAKTSNKRMYDDQQWKRYYELKQKWEESNETIK